MLTVPVELNVSIGTFGTWDIEMLWMYLIVSNVSGMSGMSGIIQLFQLLGRHIRHNRLSFHSRTSRGFCQPDGGQASKLYREYTFYKRNMQGWERWIRLFPHQFSRFLMPILMPSNRCVRISMASISMVLLRWGHSRSWQAISIFRQKRSHRREKRICQGECRISEMTLDKELLIHYTMLVNIHSHTRRRVWQAHETES
jgi:hypothetical protein